MRRRRNNGASKWQLTNVSLKLLIAAAALASSILTILVYLQPDKLATTSQHGVVSPQNMPLAQPPFVTVVMPSVVNPSGLEDRLRSISATWGSSARAIYVLDNMITFRYTADPSPSSLYPKPLILPQEIADGEHGVARLRHVIETVHRMIDPDFAFFVNDHTFVIPEHLCAYLADLDPRDDLYAGHAMRNGKDDFAFNSGAAGYVLSRSTMAKLVDRWREKDPKCQAPPGKKFLEQNPGLVTAKCLHDALGVDAIDTRDKTGSHLFHAFGLVRVVTGHVDQWYIDKHEGLTFDGGPSEKEDVTTLLPRGRMCCSDRTVSFHYVEHLETRALYEARKLLIDAEMGGTTVSDEELGSWVRSNWPAGRKQLGGYAYDLPRENEGSWADFLFVLRKISTGGASALSSSCKNPPPSV